MGSNWKSVCCICSIFFLFNRCPTIYNSNFRQLKVQLKRADKTPTVCDICTSSTLYTQWAESQPPSTLKQALKCIAANARSSRSIILPVSGNVHRTDTVGLAYRSLVSGPRTKRTCWPLGLRARASWNEGNVVFRNGVHIRRTDKEC